MNKKGVEMMTGAIITFVLLGILLVVYLAIFRPTASEAGTFFSSETLKLKDSKCLFDGQRATEKNIKFTDIDQDDRPDSCDICVNGKNDEDNDLDGMPTYCDKNDNDRTIVACSKTITKDGRCSDTTIS